MKHTPDLAALTGRLTLRPGAPLGHSLHSSRPDLVPRLSAGRPAAQLPALLGSVFSLCGHAQRWTAERAVQAALGRVTAPEPAALQAHRLATLREQLLRISHDWPRLLPGAPAQAPAALQLRACPLWREDLAPADRLAALPAWLQQKWLGMAPEAWLQAWARAPAAWPLDWVARAGGPVAALLRSQVEATRALRADGPALQLLNQPGITLPLLARQMAGRPGFCSLPDWQGEVPDTGPWAREAAQPRQPARTAWDRLVARLTEVLQLAAPGGEAWLASGALSLGPGEGLAWTEMARGLLVHRVQLDGPAGDAPRVADCRVLAPTEWNGHPQGVLARALAALPPGPASAEDAARLAVAFDPCVPFVVQTGPMLGEDAAGGPPEGDSTHA